MYVVGLHVTFEIKAAYLLTYLDFVKTKLFATNFLLCCRWLVYRYVILKYAPQLARDVKASRPNWPRGQKFGLGPITSGLCLGLGTLWPRPQAFGLGLEL